MDPFIGQVMMFGGNFAPRGWAFCDGQLLAISEYSALFSILGTTYGGDGRTTFGLPDLRGRVAIHPGTGPGLSRYDLGQRGGVETVTLTTAQIPSHSHTVEVQFPVEGGIEAVAGVVADNTLGTGVVPTELAGGGQAHENRQPYQAVNYIIALQGTYPVAELGMRATTTRRTVLQGLAAGGSVTVTSLLPGCELIDDIDDVVDDVVDQLAELQLGETQLVWNRSAGTLHQVIREEHAVARLDDDRNEIWRHGWDYTDPDPEIEPEPTLNRPTHLVPGADGSVYVVDRGNHRVVHLDDGGQVLRTFGGFGEGDGELHHPTAAAVDADGSLYVTDGKNHRVHVFDPDGTPAGTIGEFGYEEEHHINNPRGVAVDGDGQVHVVDGGNGRIHVFERGGAWVRSYGEFGASGGDGLHFSPHSVTVHPLGNAWVSDPVHKVVQIYTPDGTARLRLSELTLPDGRQVAPLEVGFSADGSVYARVLAWTEEEPPEPDPEEGEGEPR